MNATLFNQISLAFCSAEKVMQSAKAARFPNGIVVCVLSPQYTGYGIVSMEDGCRPENLSVSLENGATWHYLAQACEPATDRKKWPQWIRRAKAARARRTKNAPRTT